ncbi:MAG: hypothetical protein U9R42_13730 [Bacteroidota bacterium]|nr:hypothetical protein [Bacteroidota bacterium]
MGCHKLKYYESETAIGEKWKFFVDGIEKTVSSQDLKSYNHKSALIDGGLTALTFGIGSVWTGKP